VLVAIFLLRNGAREHISLLANGEYELPRKRMIGMQARAEGTPALAR